MTTEEFIEYHIEGNLFNDLYAMLEVSRKKTELDQSRAAFGMNPSEQGGGLCYPITITTITGMELLGYLLHKDAEFNEKNGGNYFKEYWEKLCIKNLEYKNRSSDFYTKTRHSMNHGYVPSVIYAGYDNHARSSAAIAFRDDHSMSIDVNKLVHEFIDTYRNHVKPLLLSNSAPVENKINSRYIFNQHV